MNKTLRITFSLRNTYRVNTILYSLKQIPVIGKVLPESLYQEEGLKIFANVLSGLWEIISAFLGKFLYFLLMISLISGVYPAGDRADIARHILVFLTVIGAFMNTYMFDPGKDKYYALILLRMNARQYTLINYGYAILKILIGFLIYGLIFGLIWGLPFWQCLLIPLFVAGLKIAFAGYFLWKYERTGETVNENKLSIWTWTIVALLLAAAYGLPVVGIVLPKVAVLVFMVLAILCGAVAIRRILGFDEYYEIYREILIQSMNDMNKAKSTKKHAATERDRKAISTDADIVSDRRGFEYLNELFVKRHRKVLWRSSRQFALASLCLAGIAAAILCIWPQVRPAINRVLLTYLPYFVFIMYAINRGPGFTSAIFMNCDHSLLTYPFYKQPGHILSLFRIRLRELVKINLLPAVVIGAGLCVLLYISGGTDNVLNYVVTFISVISMSAFFSVHYLTVYYLLQPYNVDTEIKSAMYRVVQWVTYFVCYLMMQVKMPTLVFGGVAILFCVLYCVIACVLVYRLAPKTFRLRK